MILVIIAVAVHPVILAPVVQLKHVMVVKEQQLLQISLQSVVLVPVVSVGQERLVQLAILRMAMVVQVVWRITVMDMERLLVIQMRLAHVIRAGM